LIGLFFYYLWAPNFYFLSKVLIMKKILPVLARLSIVACILLMSSTAFGQLTGIKNIPGDYPNVTAAVTDLNLQGVGAGGVTFNIAAGFTESTSAQITITATGTAADPIVFQKSGAGANPVITRTDAGALITSTVGGQGDAVIMLDGSDFVTFNGVDVQASNSGVEYGYMTNKPNATNGCKNITIQNSVVTMTKGTSGFVVGIHISNGPLTVASATGQTIASVAGANENITITGNTIQNVHVPVYVRGGTGSYDQNIIVGQNGAGNILQNFGGGTASTTYGVYFIYANNVSADYNTINNIAGGGTAHSSTFYGVFYSIVSGTVSGSNNAFTTSVSGTSASYSLYNGNLATTEVFNNNTFASGTFSSTGTHYMIYASSGTTNKTINANSIVGTFARTGAGAIYGYYNFGSPAGGTETITNNNFSNITNTGTGAIYGINTNTATTQNRTCTGNIVNNLTSGTGTIYAYYVLSGNNNVVNNNISNNINTGGTFWGIYASGNNLTANNNKISNVSAGGTSASYGLYAYGPTSSVTNDTIFGITQTGTGVLYGIFVSTSASTLGTVSNCEVRNLVSAGTTLAGIYVGQAAGTISRNKVFNLTSTSTTTPTVSGIQVYSNGMDVVNNIIGDIKAPAANTLSGITPSVRGINITSTSANKNINLYHNSVYLNASSTGANFGTAGVFATNSITATSARLKMVGNIIVNVSNPNGTGVVSALTRSAVGLANFDVTSNNNLYFAGSPSANKLIFNDGTNLIQTLGGYQTFALSEGSSLSFLPNFLSTVAANANFVHIDPATPTQLESGSINLNIANDFDGDVRALAAGYAGTGTAPDIGADEFNGQTPAPIIVLASVAPAAIGQCVAASRLVTATLTTLSGTITGATLNYAFNGVAQPGIAMVNTLGNDWTATIPVATPTNAVVTWSVTATNSLPLSSTANGTSFQDDPLLGVTAVAANTVSPICAGATSGVYVTLNYPAGVPPVYTTPTVFSPTADEDFGNITLIQNGVTVLNNTTALHSLVGTIGTATGIAGGYSDFSSFGPFNFVSGQPINFSLSSLTSGTAFNNVLKIFIDLNKNGSFTDPGECMYFETPSVSGAHTATGSFTIPVSSFGVTRMRVYSQETFTGNNTYTNSFSYGEYEDYTISISNISSVSWSDGVSTIGTGTSLSVTPSVTTSYTATVLSAGCTVTSNATTVTVNPLPAAPTATNSSQCGIGVPVGSVASAAGANGTGSFYWYNAPANGTTVQTPPLTPIPATSCTYTFNLTDAFGDGWNGATMQILNGAVVVATIGGSFTSGSSATQTVSLQSGVTYTLFWNNAGSYPEEVGISVVNPAGSTIYTMGATFNNPNIGTTMLTIVTDCSAAPPVGYTTGIGYTTYQSSISNTVTYYVSELGTNGCYSALTPITLTVVNPDPINITPGLTASLCLGQNIGLNATSIANPPYTFTWDALSYGGSGFAAPLAGAAQTITPSLSGIYSYVITGTNGVCTESDTVITTVNDLPVITSVTGNPSGVCNNDTINLAVSSFVNGPQVLPAGYCAVQNAGGSGSLIHNVVFNTISNNTAASPAVAPYYTIYNQTTTVNIGQTYPLTVTIDPLGIYSLTTASVWIDFNRNGVYEVSEWFNAGINIPSGTSNTVNITIPVNALPGLTGMRIRTRGNTLNNATYGCTYMGSGESEDYQVNIQAAPANPYTYTWNTIPAATGASTTTPAINNTASNLVVSYIVTATDNVTGCVSQDTTNNITIYPPILPPTVVNSAHCGIQIPTAVANDVNGFVGPNYNWYATAVNSNALQATAANTYNTLVGNTTTLYVSVEDTLTGCETASTPVTITVAAGPALTLASTLDSICVGNTTAAIGLSAGGASYNTYSWSPAAGVSGNEITGWSFNPAVSTVYTLSASQSAAPNCSNQDTISIQVDQVIPPAPTVAQNSFNVCSGTNSILLGASSPIVNNTFTYTLNFFDSFGDGWNNNTINVNVNGVAVLSGVTLPSGSNGSATFTVNGGQSITTQFNAIGAWISECTYNIVDNNGNVIFSGTPGSASGPPSLTVPYVVPSSPQPNFVINWYNASTNGANVGTGSPLQVVGTTVMPSATNGTYTFYAGLSLGACNSATTVPVTVNVADVAGTLTAVNTCINTTNGTFTASNFTCGSAPFDYSVNNGPYGPIPTNLAAGTYSVIIRDANLLFSPTYTITVGIDSTIPPAPTVPQALYSVCTGVNSVLLAATPPVLLGSQTYTLNFFDSFGDGWNGNTINVLINGVPVLNGVTLPNGSNGTATFTVNNGDVLTTQFNAIGFWIAECTYSITGPGNTLVFSGTPASAVGPPSLTNGITITTQPANPQPNYILNWYNASTNGAFVGTGSPLEAVGTTVMPTAANGTYSFYVGTSLGSCNSLTTTQVTVNVSDVAATITPINATCNGVANGSFTATNFTCGTGPFDYSVNNGAFGAIPTNLPAGNHTVVIRDANNLLSSIYNITITQPAWSINAPVAAANGSTCYGDTSEIISATSSINGQTSTVSQTFTLASNVFFGGGGTQSFTQNISLPAGATVTGTQLSFNNVSTGNFAWPSDFNVSLTGASTLGSTVLAFVNQEVANAGPYLQNPSLLNNNGGNVTVNITNTYPPGTGFFGSVTLIVTYSIPAPVSVMTWWNAPIAGAQVGTGTSLESVGTSVLVNTLTPGVYNFYAQGEDGGCTSATRTLVTVTVHALPIVAAGNDTSICIGQPIILSGTGANTYTWNNGVSNGVTFTPNATNTYSVIGIDVNGCINQDSIAVTVNPLPVVSAGNDQTVCLNTSVVLNGSGTALTYTWDNNVIDNTPFTPVTTNNYIVTGTDGNGCVDTDTAAVTVLPLPNVNAGQDFAICVGLGSTLTATGASTYQWNNNVLNGVTFFPNTTNTYTVIGTGANGCSAQDSVVVTVNTTPTISLTNGGAACANGNVALNATTTGAFGGFWSSTNGTGTFGPNVSNANVVYNANANDPATVTFVYVAFNQCGASNDTTTINILGLPTVNAGIDASVCTGTNTTLTATSTGTVVWNNGVLDGVAFPAVGGTSNYIATATDANGCTNTDTVAVTGLALPQVNAGSDQTVCAGDFVTLSASGAVTYAWDNNVIDGVPVAPLATTTYTVTGTGANGCDNTDNVTVTVNALPNAVAIQADPVTLVATPAGATYQWIDCASGQIIADATNDTLVATANGSYAVIVTNANGCSDTSDCMIVDQVGIYFPESAVIGLYPNPTNGMVTLELPAQDGATAFVYDAQGKLILTVANAQNGEQFDLSKLSTGVYTFRVTLNNLTHIEKVVKH
jgi:hypothetical protein